LDELRAQAKTVARRRKNYNFHETHADRVHRMLNAMEPGTYIQPHKHDTPDKREFFILLSGKAVVVEFDDAGNITGSALLSKESECIGAEIDIKTWHTIIPLAEGTVVFEVKDGPWDPADDKFFAPWAPAEGEAACSKYNDALLERLHL